MASSVDSATRYALGEGSEVVMVAHGIGYPEQAEDFHKVRQALKWLDHSDRWQLEHASRSEAALKRIEEAIAATLKAQTEAAVL